MGDRTRSRGAAQEAVDLYRRLAQSDPLVRTRRVAPDTLDGGSQESAAQWLRRQPLLVAPRRRADGKPARPALRHRGYPIASDWQPDHRYPGIIVD
ncbi:hypothetical protein AB0F42_24220 [Streptomyces buecherae]|uniref:hypothetical protein n=1 Tax=Streptomyces buecherae TaxID=2763006 RepID=UPI0033C920EA